MDKALFVCCGHCVGQFDAHVKDLQCSEPMFAQALAKIHPFHEFVNDEHFRAVIHEILCARHAGMTDRRRGVRFESQPPPELRIVEVFGLDLLQRHRAVEVRVEGAMDDAHPALIERLFDSVAAGLEFSTHKPRNASNCSQDLGRLSP